VRLPRQDPASVATGFATAERATPELAALAVHEALEKLGGRPAGSVLLFLTPQFHRQTQATITAAARCSRSLQVVGCTAPGVFTESQWSLDAPAAAALVLCGNTGLVPPGGDGAPVLTLATPAAARRTDLRTGPLRFGMLSTDVEGEASGRVWTHSKLADSQYCENSFSHARVAVGLSRGLRALSPALAVTDCDGLELLALDERSALSTLASALPEELRHQESLPVSHLFAAVPDRDLDAELALATGRYRLLPIIGASPEEQAVTLALPLDPGDRLFWALRRPAAAEQDTEAMLDRLAESVPDPDFALLFACIGRGPYFFGSGDRDLALIGDRHPDLPVLGAYGAGELAPLAGGNELISYSAVAALVSCVQP
jgi:small ligand-binding sensory domain FIST